MKRWVAPAAWPLTIKVPTLVAVLMIVVATAMSTVVLRRLYDDQERHLRELTGAYLDGLSTAVAPGLMRQDVWEAFDALDRARGRYAGLTLRHAIVALPSWGILASSDPVAFPVGGEVPQIYRPRSANGELALDHDRDVALVHRTMTDAGMAIGHLLAEVDISDLVAERASVLQTLILVNATMALVLAAIGYAVTRRMVQPIKLLSAHVDRVRSGIVEPIPDSRIGDERTEFGRLFRRFNAMAKAIDERESLAQRLADEEKIYLLGRLASGLAHEVNNPLGGMMNAVDTIRKHGTRPEVRKLSIDLLDRGLLGIRNVVRAALVTYKGGDHPTNLTHSDIEDLRYLVQHETIRRKVRLQWGNGLPLTVGVAVDAAAARQVVLNLLLNACAASPVGGAVEVRVSATERMFTATIEDQGGGMSPEMAALLCSPPTTAPSAKIGLGLWTASRLLDRLDGTATVDTAGRVGTLITIMIPVSRGEALHAVA